MRDFGANGLLLGRRLERGDRGPGLAELVSLGVNVQGHFFFSRGGNLDVERFCVKQAKVALGG